MNLANIFPVGDYILIALDKNHKTMATSSSLVIGKQGMADNLPCVGTVVKAGEGHMASNQELTKPPVKAGQHVKFKDYSGNLVTIEGKLHTVVKMIDILFPLWE
jgi:co-chaperonin GroES (HSP10)